MCGGRDSKGQQINKSLNALNCVFKISYLSTKGRRHNLKTGKFWDNVPNRIDRPPPIGYFRFFFLISDLFEKCWPPISDQIQIFLNLRAYWWEEEDSHFASIFAKKSSDKNDHPRTVYQADLFYYKIFHILSIFLPFKVIYYPLSLLNGSTLMLGGIQKATKRKKIAVDP